MDKNRIKILLIEDNPADVAFLEEMLYNATDSFYTITWADTLTKGIIKLQESTFSIILSDISLPDNDGLENIDKLKATAPSTAIIILTGLADIKTGIKAVELGAQDYLVKGSINTDLLVRAISYSIKRKLNEVQLDDMVLYDSLTGAVNRRPFVDLLERCILNSKRANQKLAVLFLDLEKFKQINDTYGHEAGDLILIEASKIIKDNIRGGDIFGRLGGDEFALCLNSVDSLTGVTRVAQKINDNFSEKIKINNLLLSLGVSIGIAIYPYDGENATDLLKNSDLAMYKAKKQKKNTFHVFNKQIKSELSFNQALQHALENNEFKVHYQTIVDKTLKPCFVEALLRWESPEFGNISPLDFIPILEENKSIIDVGEWVLREAFWKLKSLNENINLQNIHISINISQYQIEDELFTNKVHNMINETNVNPNNILLEITEKVHIVNINRVTSVMKTLKEFGIGLIALDDFGAGYSSFSNLIRFPLDIVKIDNFFVERLNIKKYRKITLDLISLIKNYDLKIIAEGVETREQMNYLADMGCDYFQGYYFSRPQKDIYNALNIDL